MVTEKVAAEIIPFIGAAGGAAVNLLFINHFQRIAQGHFIIRSLERKYGQEVVKEEYEKLNNALQAELHKTPPLLLPDHPPGGGATI